MLVIYDRFRRFQSYLWGGLRKKAPGSIKKSKKTVIERYHDRKNLSLIGRVEFVKTFSFYENDNFSNPLATGMFFSTFISRHGHPVFREFSGRIRMKSSGIFRIRISLDHFLRVRICGRKNLFENIYSLS